MKSTKVLLAAAATGLLIGLAGCEEKKAAPAPAKPAATHETPKPADKPADKPMDKPADKPASGTH